MHQKLLTSTAWTLDSLDVLDLPRLAEAFVGFWNRILSNRVSESVKVRRLVVVEIIELTGLTPTPALTEYGFNTSLPPGVAHTHPTMAQATGVVLHFKNHTETACLRSINYRDIATWGTERGAHGITLCIAL